MKNLKEFKELIETYESITVQDIVDSDGYRPNPDWCEPESDSWSSELVMEDLTGFGVLKCSLCQAVGRTKMDSDLPCNSCVWVTKTKHICYKGPNADTYNNFSDLNIDSEAHLVFACKKRADYMRNVLTQNEIK